MIDNAADMTAPELITTPIAAGCHAVLNRTASLNALNASIIRALHEQVDALHQDKGSKQLILSGAGQRAFCAGADIKAIYHQGRAWCDGVHDQDPMHNFFAPEYALDAALFHLDQPKTAIMDGIVMGGGYGLAAPCDIRIATENTVFAMPETGIGFFADVGAAYHLRQAPGLLGTYCAVTGATITDTGDLLALGVATHYVPSQHCAALIDALSALETPDHAAIHDIVARYHVPPHGSSPLVAQQTLIDDCFAADNAGDVLERLSGYDTDFARETKALIAARAPLSLAVTFEHCRRARGEDFDSVIQREHYIAAQFMREPCFYEGVRAMLIDKDKAPDWQPARLEEVDDEKVAGFFMPLWS